MISEESSASADDPDQVAGQVAQRAGNRAHGVTERWLGAIAAIGCRGGTWPLGRADPRLRGLGPSRRGRLGRQPPVCGQGRRHIAAQRPRPGALRRGFAAQTDRTRREAHATPSAAPWIGRAGPLNRRTAHRVPSAGRPAVRQTDPPVRAQPFHAGPSAAKPSALSVRANWSKPPSCQPIPAHAAKSTRSSIGRSPAPKQVPRGAALAGTSNVFPGTAIPVSSAAGPLSAGPATTGRGSRRCWSRPSGCRTRSRRAPSRRSGRRIRIRDGCCG